MAKSKPAAKASPKMPANKVPGLYERYRDSKMPAIKVPGLYGRDRDSKMPANKMPGMPRGAPTAVPTMAAHTMPGGHMMPDKAMKPMMGKGGKKMGKGMKK